MKTLATLTTAILITLSVSASADDKNKETRKNRPVHTRIEAPEFVWGEPSANALSIQKISLPAFTWGDPEEMNNKIFTAAAMLALPEFVWGNPEEADQQAINETGKIIQLPAFVWGNPEEL